MRFSAKKRYRPGLDDPPPTAWDRLVRMTGIAAIIGVVARWFVARPK
jgi:hypothetical protein